MNGKTVLAALAGVASALSIGITGAAAATITYTITGTGTGTAEVGTQFGTFSTPFNNVGFEIQILGDSDITGPDPTGNFIYAPTATLIGFGGTFPLAVNIPEVPLLADGPLPNTPIPGIGFAVFGYNNLPTSPNVFVSTAGFTGAGLDTYNLLNDFGPIPINFFLLPSLEVVNGPEIDFTSITNATFSAQGIPATGGAPEPATWAIMLTGFGAMGGAMRARRRRIAA